MSDRRVRGAIAAATFLALTAATAAGASSSARHGATRATKTVKAINTHWSPATVSISTGDTIKWKAISNAPHTVTAYGGNWQFNRQLSQGEVEDRTFPQAGTFRFRCRFHSSLVNGNCSGMCGKVVVNS